MSIIIDENTRVVVQGITGHQGAFHTSAMLDYGTKVVAGVTPGKGDERIEGVKVFDSMSDAMSEEPNVSIIFVPRDFAKDAALEALDNGLKTLVIISEHIPVHDTLTILQYAKLKNAIVVGPNTPGIISPLYRAKVGIMGGEIFTPGRIGIVSRSGTLTYEIVATVTGAGMGESTCIGLGGDPIVGLSFTEVLQMFERDDETSAIVLVGEIGGTAEEDACAYINKMRKPVFAYIAGITAPSGKKMGHAGAIIARGKGTAKAKIEALKDAGAHLAKSPMEIAKLLKENIK